MATIQKRGISLLLVLVLILGMIPSVSAAEIEMQVDRILKVYLPLADRIAASVTAHIRKEQ